jgi:HEAT repeat protein
VVVPGPDPLVLLSTALPPGATALGEGATVLVRDGRIVAPLAASAYGRMSNPAAAVSMLDATQRIVCDFLVMPRRVREGVARVLGEARAAVDADPPGMSRSL